MEEQAELIGVVAGKVWRQLNAEGELTIAKLARQLTERTEKVNMAIGWLAREDKVRLRTDGKNTHVSLKENAQSW